MAAFGITALNLRIVDFKFTDSFIICDSLPDTETLFGIVIKQKKMYTVICM